MQAQPSLFDRPRPKKKLHQIDRVRDVMSAGSWRTLFEIRDLINIKYDKYDSEAAISARLRDLRKEGYTVEKRKRSGNLWEYRVVG